jgi:hypothetical protein
VSVDFNTTGRLDDPEMVNVAGEVDPAVPPVVTIPDTRFAVAPAGNQMDTDPISQSIHLPVPVGMTVSQLRVDAAFDVDPWYFTYIVWPDSLWMYRPFTVYRVDSSPAVCLHWYRPAVTPAEAAVN